MLLVALVAVASSHKHFHEQGVKDQALTQAYYYATFAAGLYQIISWLVRNVKTQARRLLTERLAR